MHTDKLSKRTLASLRASLAAQQQGALPFRGAPRAAMMFIENLWQTAAPNRPAPLVVEDDPTFQWLNALATRQGATALPATAGQKNKPSQSFLTQRLTAELAILEKAQWQLALSADFVQALRSLGPRYSEPIAAALQAILRGPNEVTEQVQPLPADIMGLWQYKQVPVRLVFTSDAAQKNIFLLLLEIN